MIYLDTSALVKRYVAETGSAIIQELLRREEVAGTATIAYAEVYSGFTRRHREGYVSKRQYALACREFEREWPAYVHVELRGEVLTLARDLIQRHTLRGFDAIHLASALTLHAGLREDVTLVASDNRLLHAAAVEHLPILNVEGGSES